MDDAWVDGWTDVCWMHGCMNIQLGEQEQPPERTILEKKKKNYLGEEDGYVWELQESESEINELRCTFSCNSDHEGFLFLPKSHQFSPIPSKLPLSPIFCLGRMASHPAVPVSLSFLLSTLARCFSNSLSHHALGFM